MKIILDLDTQEKKLAFLALMNRPYDVARFLYLEHPDDIAGKVSDMGVEKLGELFDSILTWQEWNKLYDIYELKEQELLEESNT